MLKHRYKHSVSAFYNYTSGLEELSGVRQPVIARMENGSTSPQLDTVLEVLAPLGKTLYVGDL